MATAINEINTAAQVEQILQISHGTLYRFIREGKIQSATIGTKRVFTRRQIESFIHDLESQTASLGDAHISEVHETSLGGI